MKNSNLINRILYIVFFAGAAAFLILFRIFRNFPLSSFLKALPLFSLIIFVLLNLKGVLRVILLISLLFSMAGDVLLNIDRVRLFIPGLACFLAAHILYIMIFLRGFSFGRTAAAAAAAVLVYSSVLGVLLRRIEAGFIIPVYAYLVIITVMAGAAFFYRGRVRDKAGIYLLLGAGAILFMFSDTLIAVNKFLVAINYSTMFSLPLYFIAQFCIVRALVLADKDE